LAGSRKGSCVYSSSSFNEWPVGAVSRWEQIRAELAAPWHELS